METTTGAPPSRDTVIKVYHALAPTLACVAIVLNALVVISVFLVLRRKLVKAKTVYIFLGNAACADFLNGIFILIGLYYPRGNRELCIFMLGTIISCTFSSLFSVALIAVDRFLYILRGMHYRQLMTTRRSYMFIVISIIISCVLGYVPLVDWDKNDVDSASCVLVLIAQQTSLLIIACCGIIPVIIVIVLYGIIFCKAVRRVDRLRKINNPEAGGEDIISNISISNFSSPSKWKAVKVVFFTTGAFVLTWMPYFIAMLIFSFCDTPKSCDPLSRALASPLAALGFFNSVLNPIIYAWWYDGFRQTLRKLCLLRKQRRMAPRECKVSNTVVTLSANQLVGVKQNSIHSDGT